VLLSFENERLTTLYNDLIDEIELWRQRFESQEMKYKQGLSEYKEQYEQKLSELKVSI
jgi:hypothetical protein